MCGGCAALHDLDTAKQGPFRPCCLLFSPLQGGLEHEAKKKKKKILARDKTFFVLNFMLSLSSLILPSEHGRRLLIPLAQNLNPLPGPGCAESTCDTPLSSSQGIPGSLRILESSTTKIPGWRGPPQCPWAAQPSAPRPAAADISRRRHKAAQEAA